MGPLAEAPAGVAHGVATLQTPPALVYDPHQRMEQAESNLKVTDRRHFTADGELRPEVPKTSEAAPPSAAPIANEPAAQEPSDAAAVSFASFIISLATQAADYLGGDQKDLGAARQMISALEMLKDKTEGRRTDDESRILDAVLFDLRLAFVGTAKGSRS